LRASGTKQVLRLRGVHMLHAKISW
jgi:hypothetical protein